MGRVRGSDRRHLTASDGPDHDPARPGEYLLAASAGSRLDALSRLFDPWSERRLAALGLGRGWHCWEVGAGGPPVPDWLSRKVGEEGQVLATDIDVSHLGATGLPANVTVRRHDIGADPPPPETFHLVHARLVLVHVPARGDALRAMASRLRPGGWLVVEDADPGLQPLACPDETGPATALANRLRHAFRTLLEERGADLAYARTLPRRLRALDLEDVAGECYFPLGSVESAALEAATVAQIGPRLLAAGLATATDLDRHLDNVRTGRLDLATAPMVSAWGRRPTEGQKWPLAADPAHLQ